MRHPYDAFLADVDKPSRYVGGEYQEVRKDPASVKARVCLAFPDVYEIGMSHLGTKILYSILNRHPDIACERAFAPWLDMEGELRRRGLPILTLESAAPLTAFDVVGFSLQYELTYTNVLALLDLAGLPLRAAARGDDAPLIIAGGPTATHPEPLAPFIDAFFIGEAEEKLPELALAFAAMRRQGVPRRERLVRLAQAFPLYVPELYETAIDADSAFVVVGAPLDPRVPARPKRTWVADINRFPFPDDSPLPYAEAIFDRMAVEVARGCTEGCRFCQAGVIYRPVRERDPVAVVDALVGGVRKGGYDETALTSLSTADYSCVTPLVRAAMAKLRDEKVSLSVSSLRAYGLNDDLLGEMASVRAGGLTFAPEAGTQRMRDVISKNVTEEDIVESAQRVFGRGFQRMKLYFMIGLPTETDEDVRGIVETAARVQAVGRGRARGALVTASVSTHVPKPHTPFQWAAMDGELETARKQHLLATAARASRVELKMHENRQSHLEAIFSRGDRAVADLLEEAFRLGCRFDGWDDVLRMDLWERALETTHARTGLEVERYMGTIPVTARLPWDHIDVGVEPGFLLQEYRKALKDRLSPPCGKPYKKLLHPASVEEAEAAAGAKLICYDCGVACDMGAMKDERLFFLRRMNAWTKPPAPPARPEANAGERVAPVASDGVSLGGEGARGPGAGQRGDAGDSLGGEGARGSGAGQRGDAGGGVGVGEGRGDGDGRGRGQAGDGDAGGGEARASGRGRPKPTVRIVQGEPRRYRLRYAKLGRVAYLGHLDLIRHLPRVFRRAGVEMHYSVGFHPKPGLSFGPALGLGVPSLGEVLEVKMVDVVEAAELRGRLQDVTLGGIDWLAAAALGEGDRSLGRVLDASDWLALVPDDVDLDAALGLWLGGGALSVRREAEGRGGARLARTVDVRRAVRLFAVVDDEAARARLDWGAGRLVRFRTTVGHEGGARPTEVLAALLGADAVAGCALARLGLRAGEHDPLDLAALRSAAAATVGAPDAADGPEAPDPEPAPDAESRP